MTCQEVFIDELGIQAQEFGREVTRRGLPIGEERAAEFGKFLLSHNAPNGLLLRLSSAVGFIDQDTLKAYFVQLADTAKGLIDDKPYFLAQHKLSRSGQWVYENLLALGVQPAEKKFVDSDESEVIGTDYISLDRLTDEVPEDARIFIFDDWALTAGNTIDVLFSLGSQMQPFILNFATTRLAERYIFEYSTSSLLATVTAEPITLLDDVLLKADVEFFNKLYTLSEPLDPDGAEAFGIHHVLFSSVHKTNDRVPDIFTGERRMKTGQPIPPLIEPVIPLYDQASK